MATLSDLQTRVDAALAAMDAGDWATAQRQANAALLILSTTPATQFDGGDQIRFDVIGAAQSMKQIVADARARAWDDQTAAQLIEYRRG